MTTKDKLIEKQKELILFYEKKLSVGEINSAYDYKKQMFLIESELAKEPIINLNQPIGSTTDFIIEQEPEGVTAEEILNRVHNIERMSADMGDSYVLKRTALRAMEEYAKSKQINLRDELMHFVDYFNHGYDHDYDDKFIDEYLQSKR